ncbi:MAG: ABC-2 transporter permease [Eubacteriales bacterium]|nr:ABC-2 transporter permease [Eubacteriales bacterium]
MKGLLLKDWYCMVKQSRSYFLIDLVFFAAAIFNAGNLFFLTYPCLTAGLCTMAMISYEEYDGWDKYAAGLPYTRAELVSSKYLWGLLNILAVGMIAAVIQGVTMARLGVFALEGYLSFVLLLFVIGLVPSALLNPFLYKFGVTKGRIIYYFLVGTVCGLAVVYQKNAKGLPATGKGTGTALLAAAFAVLLYGLSWLLSIHCYKKREL